MAIRKYALKPVVKWVGKSILADSKKAIENQERWRNSLLNQAKNTVFGKEHGFADIKSYEVFKSQIPLRDYEDLRPYVERIIAGENDVLWKGRPIYFAKTSGTTSGVKYIPISKQSIGAHFGSARNALFLYAYKSGNTDFFDGKMIFLSGSPEMNKHGGILTGRLSGIVNHHIPSFFRTNQLPDYKTNCIEDWEEKVEKIVEQSWNADLRLISGIPPWVQMYFDKLQEKTGKLVGDLFPNLSVLVHGGVNFRPYANKLNASIGRDIAQIETYPASEGFIAYQHPDKDAGLLLNSNAGIFYEFIELNDINKENPNRLSLADVKVGVNYAIALSSNAGLWSYLLGDTVEFSSIDPPLLKVSGRVKHFISAFGEHVIGEEVERAMAKACDLTACQIAEFTVAPKIGKGSQPSYHEWWVAFEKLPNDEVEFTRILEEEMLNQNAYYKDLIDGNILAPLQLVKLPFNAFQLYMKAKGKLGGQNKVPRLANDRKLVKELKIYSEK